MSKNIDIIVDTLDELDKVTLWIFLTLMLMILSSNETDEFEFGGFKLKKGNSGLVLYLILCALNFQVLKLFQSLSSFFYASKNRSEVIITMQSHLWIFNPFCRTEGVLSSILDNIGFPILIVVWWIGFALVTKEISNKSAGVNYPPILVLIMFSIYLILGILSLILMQDILLTMGNNLDRMFSQFLGIICGSIFFFYYTNKKNVFKKNK